MAAILLCQRTLNKVTSPSTPVPPQAASHSQTAQHEASSPEVAWDICVLPPGKTWTLTYLAPPGQDLQPGQEVSVPVGAATRRGLVLRKAHSPELATRHVAEVIRTCAHPADMEAAEAIAERHATSIDQLATRLAPTRGRDDDPLDKQTAAVSASLTLPAHGGRRRLYLTPPLLDLAQVAANEAVRVSAHGSVLILCPTVASVTQVMTYLHSGAVRADTKARQGSWKAFRNGSIPIAVGTRAAAWWAGPHMGGIIVVDDGHAGHTASSMPYTTSVEVARERSRQHDCALTLITHHPTATALGCGVKAIDIGTRADWPRGRIIDRGKLPPGQRRTPPQLASAIDKARSRDLEVVAIAQTSPARRICLICKAARDCRSCESLECGHTQPPCPRCASTATVAVGWDSTRIEQTLQVRGLTLAALAALPRRPRLVIMPDLDRMLAAPAMDSAWWAMRALMSASVAAGKGGEVLIVTSDPGHTSVAAWADRDIRRFAKRTWGHAREHGLPPFCTWIQLRSTRNLNVSSWPGTIHGPRKRERENEVLIQATPGEFDKLKPLLHKARSRGKMRIRIT